MVSLAAPIMLERGKFLLPKDNPSLANISLTLWMNCCTKMEKLTQLKIKDASKEKNIA